MLTLFLILFVLFKLSLTLDQSAYCDISVKRPMKVRENGIEKIEFIEQIKKDCCKGYTKFSGKCIPLCETICINAKCIAPNVCSCKSGYKKLDENRCEPICHNCENGFCSAPGICTCQDDFEKNSISGKCTRKCDPVCVNGYCVGENVCVCNEGYQKSKHINTCLWNNTPQTTSTPEENSSSWHFYDYAEDEITTINQDYNAEPFSTSETTHEKSIDNVYRYEEENVSTTLNSFNAEMPSSSEEPNTFEKFFDLNVTDKIDDNHSIDVNAELSKTSESSLVWIPIIIVATLVVIAIIVIIYINYGKGSVYNVDRMEKRQGTLPHFSCRENYY